jgi:hypothetical protein
MRRFAIALALLLVSAPAFADAISDNIAAALKAYQAGDMRTAKQRLDMASQQIAQRNAQLLGTILPRPYKGWTAEKPEVVGMGNLLGGMITAKRTYRSPDGRHVTLTIVGDSPMLAAFLGLIQNPQVVMMSGNKVVTIGGNQAMIAQNGDIQMAVGTRWLITADGSAPPSHKQGYVAAVNFRALAQIR